jgi:hypothetical protein
MSVANARQYGVITHSLGTGSVSSRHGGSHSYTTGGHGRKLDGCSVDSGRGSHETKSIADTETSTQATIDSLTESNIRSTHLQGARHLVEGVGETRDRFDELIACEISGL